ncbi:aspartate/glutamate racemase family protein [Gymnodinialimonas sp. 2305UL16-5]|uniref:aspartate/glutamate racemase family protein n=1 Tax=Gymnodinialimonas mytili TaxID=3126503 RepID=UPI0030B0CB09
MNGGASVGILMLDTQFPRIPGDIGNAASFSFPVQYRIVPGATPEAIVRRDPTLLVQDFIAAGRDLVVMGCDGIVTTCGFLTLLQADLAKALGVPVATSALMQTPMIAATLPPGRHVSILTISADDLSPAHLAAAQVPEGTPVMGSDPNGAFARTILGDQPQLDVEACRADLMAAAERLIQAHPQTGAVLLECTNMVPYAADISRAIGRPVFSVHTLLTWFQAGLRPQRFAEDPPDPPV